MDFTVGRGDVFGFLGPSGAGKSTTQKLLIGLLRGHGGETAVWRKDPLAGDPTITSALASRSSCPTTTRS
jgi:fluoroquinolone transport system ATP-binding protein